MDKYTILLILNLPFVIYGYIKALEMYNKGSSSRIGFALRLIFWSVILLGLLFAENLYDFLSSQQLSDTSPLSLAEVLLTTGVIFLLVLCVRIYSRLDKTERRLADLHEKLSIELSKKNN